MTFAMAGDLPVKVSLQRLEMARRDPPGADWDGVFEMSTR